MSRLTVDALRNASRRSGFVNVTYAASDDFPSRKPYQARAGNTANPTWRGPRRATGEEAAQDYCDHINNGGGVAPSPLLSAGHVGRRDRVSDPELDQAWGMIRDRRAQIAGKQGYIYCIEETDHVYAVKIGYSTNPEARLAELQTGNPRILKLIGYFEGTLEDERRLHAKYADLNILQEWFRPTDELLLEFAILPSGAAAGSHERNKASA